MTLFEDLASHGLHELILILELIGILEFDQGIGIISFFV